MTGKQRPPEANPIPTPLFIIGSARSGTTSLARTLATSPDARVCVEPSPNLNSESRAMWEGSLPDPHAALDRHVGPRIAAAADQHRVYIEKQVSLTPFIEQLHAMYGARFICPVRDGRDVVSSMLAWHGRMYPIIYREAAGGLGELGLHAAEIERTITLPDPFDHSLPRPLPGDPWHEPWPYLDRFEMCAWYWNHVNTRMLDLLENIPREAWILVSYDRPTPDCLEAVFEFAGLDGFDQGLVESVLAARVNSLADRIGEPPHEPHEPPAPAPDENRRQRFHDLAHDALARLGYWTEPHRPAPPGFGAYWRDDQQANEQWFAKIHEYRESSHNNFLDWINAIEPRLGRFASIIDVGSGIGHGYTEAFADREYTGIDLSPEVVDLANNLAGPTHRFIRAEIIDDPPRVRADLVCCHASIDNLYDIDAALRSIAAMARKAVYISTYRDYRGGLADHRYTWDPKMSVYFNDVSPARVERVLRDAGFRSVVVFPNRTGRDDHTTELVIAAAREPGLEGELTSGHTVGCDFKPYTASPAPAPEPASDVLDIVDAGCAAFAPWGKQLQQPVSDFAGFAASLTRVLEDTGRVAGRLRDVNDPDNPATLGVRVDIDIDLSAALSLAHVSKDAGLPLSFYVLHTAGYYGRWEGDTFLRHEGMSTHYLRLQELGHEVGLHTDALALYQDRNTDGAEAIGAELAWLRSVGLDIKGTSGHNMVGLYGAENAEVFRQHKIREQPFLNRRGRYIPLGTLDEQELGLTYDAGNPTRAFETYPPEDDPFIAGVPRHDFLRDPRWLRRYLTDNPYCRWGWDLNIWHLGAGEWAISQPGRPDAFEFAVDAGRVLELIAALPPERTVTITIHPIYFGKRPLPIPHRHEAPALTREPA